MDIRINSEAGRFLDIKTVPFPVFEFSRIIMEYSEDRGRGTHFTRRHENCGQPHLIEYASFCVSAHLGQDTHRSLSRDDAMLKIGPPLGATRHTTQAVQCHMKKHQVENLPGLPTQNRIFAILPNIKQGHPVFIEITTGIPFRKGRTPPPLQPLIEPFPSA